MKRKPIEFRVREDKPGVHRMEGSGCRSYARITAVGEDTWKVTLHSFQLEEDGFGDGFSRFRGNYFSEGDAFEAAKNAVRDDEPAAPAPFRGAGIALWSYVKRSFWWLTRNVVVAVIAALAVAALAWLFFYLGWRLEPPPQGSFPDPAALPE